MSEPVIRRFGILTVNCLGKEIAAFPRSACLTLRRDGPVQLVLKGDCSTFDLRFRRAVQTVWSYVRALLPEESEGLSLQLSIKARDTINDESVGLPLTLALLSALLDDPLPECFYGTGLMYLADGWFAGRLLGNMQAKADALGFVARHQDRQTTLAIPYCLHMPLPRPVPRVRYLQLAHIAHAAAELFPCHAQRVQERFRALSTLERLPFEQAIKRTFRQNNARTIVLEYDDRTQRSEIWVSQEGWGPTVWARYPGLPGGGAMIYRFEGHRLLAKEQFGNLEDAWALSELLSDS